MTGFGKMVFVFVFVFFHSQIFIYSASVLCWIKCQPLELKDLPSCVNERPEFSLLTRSSFSPCASNPSRSVVLPPRIALESVAVAGREGFVGVPTPILLEHFAVTSLRVQDHGSS